MTNPPTRVKGHLQYKDYFRGRFDVPNQKDLKDKLEFFRGDTILFEVQVFDRCDDPVDITDWAITFTVKCEEWDTEIIYQVNSVDDPAHVFAYNAPVGVIHALIPTSVSSILESSEYIFDVQLRKVSTDPLVEDCVKTVVRAWFLIKRDVTT